jgi:7,8-dihydropterin-6-yl-methyl-4-(beta-D-ribofuranosyl)aminobenzene 5'-phosphate synthase
VIGGTHLANARAELIQSTIRDLKALNPDLVVPAHCTGFEAIVAFSREMPNEFGLNTAGTQYTFVA